MQNCDIKIIVAIESISMVAEVLSNSAFSVIPKPIVCEDAKKEIIRALEAIRKEKSTIKIMFGPEIEFITVNEIVYIESFDKITIIHMCTGKNAKSTETLKYYTEKLYEYDFVKVHRSYLINLNFVVKQTRQSVSMYQCDLEIPISRKCKASYLKRLELYLQRKIL